MVINWQGLKLPSKDVGLVLRTKFWGDSLCWPAEFRAPEKLQRWKFTKVDCVLQGMWRWENLPTKGAAWKGRNCFFHIPDFLLKIHKLRQRKRKKKVSIILVVWALAFWIYSTTRVYVQRWWIYHDYLLRYCAPRQFDFKGKACTIGLK